MFTAEYVLYHDVNRTVVRSYYRTYKEFKSIASNGMNRYVDIANVREMLKQAKISFLFAYYKFKYQRACAKYRYMIENGADIREICGYYEKKRNYKQKYVEAMHLAEINGMFNSRHR